ncbi:MAG: serine/threonine-protein kinase [Myxococcota bacterium]
MSTEQAPRILYERYRIEERIAAGSAGFVYSAVDTHTGEDVVVKLFPDAALETAKGAWAREMRLAFRLSHPNIVRCLNAGFSGSDQDSILVFERISGGSLRRWLVQEGQLPNEELVRLLRDLAAALGFAHRHGVIHRDVKPENILREEGRWLLTDFGSGRHLSPDDAASTLIGSLGYIGPETFLNRTVFASDQFGLGVTAWECMGNERPSDQTRAQAWLDGRRRTDLMGVVSVLMAGHPERRWPHMPAIATLLGPTSVRDHRIFGRELLVLGERSVTAVSEDGERVCWRGSRARRFCHLDGEKPTLAGDRRIVDLGGEGPDTLFVREDPFEVLACSRHHRCALLRDEDGLHLVAFHETGSARSWPAPRLPRHLGQGYFIGPTRVVFLSPGDRRALYLELEPPVLRPREGVLPLPFVEARWLEELLLLCGSVERTELIRPQLGPERRERAQVAPDHVRIVRGASGPSLEVVPPLARPELPGEPS